jgi:hypothetical protein
MWRGFLVHNIPYFSSVSMFTFSAAANFFVVCSFEQHVRCTGIVTYVMLC